MPEPHQDVWLAEVTEHHKDGPRPTRRGFLELPASMSCRDAAAHLSAYMVHQAVRRDPADVPHKIDTVLWTRPPVGYARERQLAAAMRARYDEQRDVFMHGPLDGVVVAEVGSPNGAKFWPIDWY